MRTDHRHLVATIAFTSMLLGLIVLALGDTNPGVATVALIAACVLATMFHFLLPGSDFFSAVFANSIGIYACVYVFFLSQNFRQVGVVAQELGFALPLAGFLIGSIWRRREIIAAVGRDEKSERSVVRDIWSRIVWIPPLIGVGVASFVLPLAELSPADQDEALLGGMTIIALTALLAAGDIAAFLLDTALLFGDFFGNIARLTKPAFAFFTCYSLLAIIFGCLYTILDRFSAISNFIVSGVARKISLAEGLYLSVVTLSTVGYGDLSAASPLARSLVAVEIFAGVMLLLFGVQAILTTGRK